MREHVGALVSELAPIADDLYCGAEFAGARTILESGASYERQLRVAEAADGDLHEVVHHLIREFRSGPGAPVV
jgi:carboxylate-amine ligase